MRPKTNLEIEFVNDQAIKQQNRLGGTSDIQIFGLLPEKFCSKKMKTLSLAPKLCQMLWILSLSLLLLSGRLEQFVLNTKL